MTPIKVIDTQWQNPEMHPSAKRGRVTGLGVGCMTGQGRVTRDRLSMPGRRVRVRPSPMALRGDGTFLSYLDRDC